MTVHKEQYMQYMDGLGNLFTDIVFYNLASFKKNLLSAGVTNIMEVYYSPDQVLVFCEFDESTTIYEAIDKEEFVDWCIEVTKEEPEPEDAA